MTCGRVMLYMSAARHILMALVHLKAWHTTATPHLTLCVAYNTVVCDTQKARVREKERERERVK